MILLSALYFQIFTGEQKVYFYFFQKTRTLQSRGVVTLSHLDYLPFPYMEGIVLICNTDLYCVIAIFNGTGNMFKR